MTEFSEILSQLSTTAEALNRESDSINGLISQFQETLRKLNVGFAVWLERPILVRPTGAAVDRVDQDGDPYEAFEAASVLTRLGYAKGDSGWLLLARHQTHLDSTRERVGSGEEEPLLQAAREVRIAAIEAFPLLASELQRKAEAALDTIRNAFRNADKLQQ